MGRRSQCTHRRILMWAAFIMQEFPMIIVLMNEIAFDSEHDATNTQSFRQAPYQSQHPLWLCEWAGRSVFIVVGGWKVYNFIQSAPEKVFAFNLVLLTVLSLYLSYCIYPSSWYRCDHGWCLLIISSWCTQ